jgi:hypothetical protein
LATRKTRRDAARRILHSTARWLGIAPSVGGLTGKRSMMRRRVAIEQALALFFAVDRDRKFRRRSALTARSRGIIQ